MKAYDQVLDRIMPRMIAFGEDLYHHPEIGYREEYAHAKMCALLDEAGISYRTVARTGIKATLDLGRPGPHIVLLAEFDGVPVPSHPEANADQCFAAPACGHYAQAAVMMGVFLALNESSVAKTLCGKVSFIASPAEEYCDLAFRQDLIDRGEILFAGGKQHLIAAGEFDDADIILNCHAMGGDADGEIGSSLNGFLHKDAVFTGKAAHAAAAPEDGVNALNAATLAMSAINFLRETFRAEDAVRVHYYLPEGGKNAGTVPEETRIELFVRARSAKAISEIGEKVDRCLKAGAYAVGCDVTITDNMGYYPLKPDPLLSSFVEERMARYMDPGRILRDRHGFASGDIGDVSMMWPTIQTGVSGFGGTFHGRDFRTTDTHNAYEVPAVYFLDTVYDLLADGGKEAYRIAKAFRPTLIRDRYASLLKTKVTKTDCLE
ncbi:MAG: peptidase dimerization domain-containing protein [Lachnospiraceae bacterium]|nr:peptidase dimerization domain-containing protein [Lachnospiraceae bacterium]